MAHIYARRAAAPPLLPLRRFPPRNHLSPLLSHLLLLLLLLLAMDGGYSPRFHRQASCSCAPSISRRGFVRAGFDLDGDDYDDDYLFHPPAAAAASKLGGPYSAAAAASHRSSARARLRGLWRRILREKRRILLCTTGCVPAPPASALAREPYDEYSYAQNFDDGEAWVEPDNLSRSFSARFAVPSRVLQRVAV
ncbi:hypothetical protein ACP4OV_022182 [Aristida adscensionis]